MSARSSSPDTLHDAPVLTLVEHARRLVGAALPTVTDRRSALRQLAEHVDDLPTDDTLLPILVASLSDLGLPATWRRQCWERLVETVALLDALDRGAVEARLIVPGANPNIAYSVAAEALELDIRRCLEQLVTGSPA